jgi:hypothetical protein
MRKALLVGIDNYPSSPLAGCVADAERMGELLSRHHDGSPNFECLSVLSSKGDITKASLRRLIGELFASDNDVALLYFAGHGTFNNLGGFLVTPDAKSYDEGVPMTAVLTLVNKSPAREAVILLDCCHSGAFGQLPAIDNENANLRLGVSALTACRETESAVETGVGGLFTSLVYAALNGGAADVCGNVTIASVYAYVDQTLGAWQQRPLFKSHVSKLIPLRRCAPAIPLEILRLLPKYFRTASEEFLLDPSYEPDALPKNEEHEKTFSHLQKYRSAHLLVPVGEEHMYFAAMNSKSCRLTALGKFYWNLANSGKL